MYTITPHSETHSTTLDSGAATTQAVTYTFTDGILTGSASEADSQLEGESLSVDNGLLQLNLSKTTGRLTSLTNHQAGVATNLTLDIAAYLSGKSCLFIATVLLVQANCSFEHNVTSSVNARQYQLVQLSNHSFCWLLVPIQACFTQAEQAHYLP